LLADVVSKTNDVAAWSRLLGFANCCFTKANRGGKSRNLTSLVIKQTSAYIAKFKPKMQQVAGGRQKSISWLGSDSDK